MNLSAPWEIYCSEIEALFHLCMEDIDLKGTKMIDIVNICGIPYKVELQTTHFEADARHFGEIDYKRGVITIADDMSEEITKETLYHEIIHGMLVHIGRSDLTMDEQLVQALGNAIYQTFEIKSNAE